MDKNTRVSRGSSKTTSPTHPGRHLRNTVLTPKRLTVQAAAKLLGIGRPALSNFLNGHVSTSPEMAARIERAFGLNATDLLSMQAQHDAWQASEQGTPTTATPYVAPFLSIKARDIEAWTPRNIAARTRLSVFIRTLVNSTGHGLTRADFPGNDDAERPGWDGYTEAANPTPWIPEGRAGWELGTTEDISRKATIDFEKGVDTLSPEERAHITFVFVTPRHWPAKARWVKEHASHHKWKNVRAYDSSDLEQWLEQSVPAQAWFANETLRPSEGVRSLDRIWSDWADDPKLSGSLFLPAISGAKQTVQTYLSKPPAEPLIVAADSTAEALAFLTQLFGPHGGSDLSQHRDRVLVFESPGVLSKLAQGSKQFIAVAATKEVERELGPHTRSMHSIVVHPRNSANATPHVDLQPLTHAAFRLAMEQAGCTRDEISRHAAESGRSLTVLRRRLSNIPAIRTPTWATHHEAAIALLPFMLVGSWCSTNTQDQAAITQLAAARTYEELEVECQRLTTLDDAPLWSMGTYRGTVSKIDLLFAIAGLVTTPLLQRYFELARQVLGEDDPALALPAEERWASALHSKPRGHSPTLRKGVSETLVLLAVHGNNLFRDRLGFDCELHVNQLVRQLLTPFCIRTLEAHSRDLPSYAEAAPNEFLSLLETDLQCDHPASYGLLRPAETGILGGGCPRTGLLWALENLAWSRETLPRAALLLAKLAQVEVRDNWMNKPINSLKSIFSAWMPQTDPDHNTRLGVIKLLAAKVPQVAWQICLSQLDVGGQLGHFNHKPTWRNDGYGFGEPFTTSEPVLALMQEMADMALSWPAPYTSQMLCGLVQNIHALDGPRQSDAWALVTKWSASAPDADKAIVREAIRVAIMSRRGARRAKQTDHATLTSQARIAYQSMEPADLLEKHEWLFREQWVAESAEELQNDPANFQEREARIAKLRTDALGEIVRVRGINGIVALVERGKASGQIGWLLAKEVLPRTTTIDLLVAALRSPTTGESAGARNLIAGILSAFDDEDRVALLHQVKENISQGDFLKLLLLAPFRRSTWLVVDSLDEASCRTYWQSVSPAWIHNTPDEGSEAVVRLLASKRPRAAFACIHFVLDAIDPELLFRMMSAIARESEETPGHYQLDRYYIKKAFQIIDKSPIFTVDQKAQLEFLFIEALSRRWDETAHGIPNLEKYVERHPETFVQAVVWAYKRDDEGCDPSEWRVGDDMAKQTAIRSYKLIESLTRIPGHDHRGELDAGKLGEWIKAVRDTCASLSRLDIADICIGKLLSNAPIGRDGVWPCEPVRQVMEDIHSRSMMSGAHTGLYNSRGIVCRGEGGAQERDIANKYRKWAQDLAYSHPFVAYELMMDMTKTYEREAHREDAEAGIGRRLG